jgi:hypothetical protein
MSRLVLSRLVYTRRCRVLACISLRLLSSSHLVLLEAHTGNWVVDKQKIFIGKPNSSLSSSSRWWARYRLQPRFSGFLIHAPASVREGGLYINIDFWSMNYLFASWSLGPFLQTSPQMAEGKGNGKGKGKAKGTQIMSCRVCLSVSECRVVSCLMLSISQEGVFLFLPCQSMSHLLYHSLVCLVCSYQSWFCLFLDLYPFTIICVAE